MLKELEGFGLGEKEAKVYVATLELAQATVQQIAQKSGVNRATTYVQLESLKDRGLITLVTKSGKTFFVAESPENVKKIIEKDKFEVLFREKEFNKILPNLLAIYNAQSDRPGVRFYEGAEAISSYREEILKNKLDYFYAIIPVVETTDEPFDPAVLLSVLKKVKDFRLILTSEKKIPIVDEFVDKHKVNIRIIHKSKLNIATEVIIFSNKLWINTLKGKPGAVLIEDRAIAESFRLLHEFIWSVI